MLADYWIIRKRYINLSALYRHPDIYSFWRGFNLRAMIAFFCGIAPSLPGLAAATGRQRIPITATYIYSVNWCLGVAVSLVVYLTLSIIWKLDNSKAENSEPHNISETKRLSV